MLIDISNYVIDYDFVIHNSEYEGKARETAKRIWEKGRKIAWFFHQDREQQRVSVRIRKATNKIIRYYNEQEI